jgi:hypothetical protein
MDRFDELRKHLLPRLESGSVGLEIAPWHSPVLPKAAFPSVRTLDVFPQSELIARARTAEPQLSESSISAIEPVDFVGNAARLGEAIPPHLHGQFSFILSSHNFEHIPNPIRFLADCFDILTDDGVLVMAIPDKRACFDHWRPVSTLGQLVDAHVDRREMPSIGQQVDHSLGRAFVRSGEGVSTVFSTETPDEEICSDETRFSDFADRLGRYEGGSGGPSGTYVSAHCWTFVPESFALLMRDLNALKLANLFPMEISEPRGAEFFVHLSKTPITYPERTHMCRTLMAALGERKVLAKHDPRRYRRTFATYMAGLSLLDRLLGHR